MPTKAEIADRIGSITGDRPDPDKHNAQELQAMLEAAEIPDVPLDEGAVAALRKPGGVTRRKVNKGSTRRINRAATALQAALHTFATEIDTQVFITDDDGNRIAPHPLVEEVRAQAAALPNLIAEFTTPAAAPTTPQE